MTKRRVGDRSTIGGVRVAWLGSFSKARRLARRQFTAATDEAHHKPPAAVGAEYDVARDTAGHTAPGAAVGTGVDREGRGGTVVRGVVIGHSPDCPSHDSPCSRPDCPSCRHYATTSYRPASRAGASGHGV